MVFDPLANNYQRVSTNRFVVDSPRFWSPKFHPRFNNLYEFADIQEVFEDVNKQLSFIFTDELIQSISIKLYEYFSGHRVVFIPSKTPEARLAFLSDLFFTLMDILPQISFINYPVDTDDFNVVTQRAETGKNDTTRTATNETQKTVTNRETQADILTQATIGQTDTASVENIDDEQKRNLKNVNDVFLSAQDQGRKPITSNLEYTGVDGIELQNPGTEFTTNVANVNEGETTKSKTNTGATTQQAEKTTVENNDLRTTNTANNETIGGQDLELVKAKDDRYIETLSLDKSGKLLEFSELADKRLWNEILRRLSRWVLRANIALSYDNYLECPEWD